MSEARLACREQSAAQRAEAQTVTAEGGSASADAGSVTAERKWLFMGAIAVLALAADLVTKRLVLAYFVLGERHELIPGLAIQHVYNRGVAFGLLSGRSGVIGAVAFVAIAIILIYAAYEPRFVPAALGGGLLLGGSLGNLVERLAAGRVTDFIKLPHWPNFNLADVFIVAGVAVVAIYLLADLLRPPERGLPGR
ncbi:MAG: hypothetical protein Kow00129_14200 [Thermoleophilia bacterium]